VIFSHLFRYGVWQGLEAVQPVLQISPQVLKEGEPQAGHKERLRKR